MFFARLCVDSGLQICLVLLGELLDFDGLIDALEGLFEAVDARLELRLEGRQRVLVVAARKRLRQLELEGREHLRYVLLELGSKA